MVSWNQVKQLLLYIGIGAGGSDTITVALALKAILHDNSNIK